MDDASTTDMAIFWGVVALRFFVPLIIPRYPLPGVVAALIIDGVDQSIFQSFTSLNLDGYQGYDKALDVYYLSIAYISTLRNWTDLFAFKVSRFLFYWRLVGVTAFELLQWRPLLIIFPNTFEYFFIFYEAVRLRWDPARMSKRLIVGAAAFIWIFIKLPQEYWIHIAQLDATDFIKETFFNASPDTPWGELLRTQPGPFIVAGVLIVALLALAWWVIKNKLPPKDWSLTFAVDEHLPMPAAEKVQRAKEIAQERLINNALLEKIVFVGLVTIIFAQVLDVAASNLEVAFAVAFVIVLNTAVSHWLAHRGVGWESALREFFVMAVLNFGLILLFAFLLPNFDGSINLTNTLFFALLLTLIVVLFDRYRYVHEARFAEPA